MPPVYVLILEIVESAMTMFSGVLNQSYLMLNGCRFYASAHLLVDRRSQRTAHWADCETSPLSFST